MRADVATRPVHEWRGGGEQPGHARMYCIVLFGSDQYLRGIVHLIELEVRGDEDEGG